MQRKLSQKIAVLCWAWTAAAGCSLQAHADNELRIELSEADAEVWAYELDVRGDLFGVGELKACQVQVAQRRTNAQLTGATAFRAHVLLHPGDNAVQAHCRTRAGQLITAPTRHYQVQLSAAPKAVARITAPATYERANAKHGDTAQSHTSPAARGGNVQPSAAQKTSTTHEPPSASDGDTAQSHTSPAARRNDMQPSAAQKTSTTHERANASSKGDTARSHTTPAALRSDVQPLAAQKTSTPPTPRSLELDARHDFAGAAVGALPNDSVRADTGAAARNAPTPDERAERNRDAATGSVIVLDAGESRPNASTGRALVRYEWFAGDLEREGRLVGEGIRLTVARPAQRQLFSLRVSDDRGERDLARVVFRPEQDAGVEQDLRAAVVYGLLPPLYGSPPLRAATTALPRLAELGVDVLWLAPLFRAPPGDFGYAVTDYFNIRADYGSDAELRVLIDRAHALGMRVLLDLPANHSSREHPYFQEASALGLRSHYFDFYARDQADQPTHYFDWENLPNLNYANPEVVQFMGEAAAYWLRAFRIDGYRLDAAWGIRERNPDFWPQLSAALGRTHPEHVLIAEASARDAYYQAPVFAAAYDWTNELGQHAWKNVFDAQPGIAQRLAAAVSTTPNPEHVLRFLNNNDTGARFITRHGPDLTRVATAALLTLPGLPCLYTFDEVGAEFEPYGTLTPIHGDNAQLRAFHKRWIALRHQLRALSGKGFEIIHAGPQNEVLAFIRSDGEEHALVVLNFSARPQQLTLALNPEHWPSGTARDLTQPKATRIQTRPLNLRIQGWDARIFVPN